MKDKNTLTAERLKQCRIEHDKTLEQIGTLVGVHKTTVMRWENGETERIGLPTIQTLASYYNVNPAWLVGADTSKKTFDTTSIENIIPMPKIRKIPLLGTIACGEPILAVENIEDNIDIPEHINADFALRCKGDSMINARIYDGDIVYIRQHPDVNNGDIAAVLIDDEATLKRVYKNANQVILQAENPAYTPMVFTEADGVNVRILGKAVGFTSKI